MRMGCNNYIGGGGGSQMASRERGNKWMAEIGVTNGWKTEDEEGNKLMMDRGVTNGWGGMG